MDLRIASPRSIDFTHSPVEQQAAGEKPHCDELVSRDGGSQQASTSAAAVNPRTSQKKDDVYESSRKDSVSAYTFCARESFQKATPRFCIPVSQSRQVAFDSPFGPSTLTPLTVADTEWMFRHLFSNEEVLVWYRDGKGRTREETYVFLQERQDAWQRGLLAGYCIFVGEQRAGYLGCGAVREGMMELGYALAPSFWGKGLATASVCAALRFFDQLSPDFHGIFATAHPNNSGSNAVLKKAGFAHVESEKRIEYDNAYRNFYVRDMPWRSSMYKAA